MIRTRNAHQTRAFSLVEILIAILVLGFGLLGLAAVFPVVVSQQRDAANEMRGPSAVASVKAQLIGTQGLIEWDEINQYVDNQLTPSGGFGVGSIDSGRWAFDNFRQNLDNSQRLIRIVPTNGAVQLRLSDNTWNQFVPVTARVYPSVYGSVNPQFVWDLALRRTALNQPLEVALFVRRLDPGIRVPDDKRLANVLTGEGLRPGGNVQPNVVPLGETPSGGNDNERRPSGNGTGDYSRLRELFVDPEHAGGNTDLPIDRFPIPNGSSKLVETLVGRQGQLLLDDLGVVREVQGFESDGGQRMIVVDPPFPSLDERIIVYAPQTPVAIEIFTVEGN